MAATLTKARKPTSPAPARRVAVLHEDFVPGTATRVDRDKGCIYGVKVLGRISKNSHKIPGADHTEYTMEALYAAVPLYEGLKVNVDHPPREKVNAERSSRDRLGWLKNVQVREDGIYADLHLLKSDGLTEKLFEAAERNPELFGLSHNAIGQWDLEGNVAKIMKITEVHSVDVVADGGSVSSLFESKERNRGEATRQVGRGGPSSVTGRRGTLRENEQQGYPMPEEDMGAAPAMDGRSMLSQAAAALAGSGDPADHELGMKVMKLLKPEEESAPVAETDEEPAKDEEKKDEPMKESLQKKVDALTQENVILQECLQAGVQLNDRRKKVLLALDAGERKEQLAEWHGKPVAKTSAAARSTEAPLKESKTTNAPDWTKFSASIRN